MCSLKLVGSTAFLAVLLGALVVACGAALRVELRAGLRVGLRLAPPVVARGAARPVLPGAVLLRVVVAAASALGASFLAAVLVDFLATARAGVFAERVGSSRDLPAAALREVRAVFDLVMVQNFL
jgi:hypothetical protein